ncbi:zinc finger protein 573-like [Galendromus occidentalis]|uniref:Zinc finger protein 573-like n=1 Tax=Galendromus occidentalis TaxID=34638 RepID=A0AAJ7L395_9ACAR|nr:zinc finger protein 573-like [Galendromus occidentalis]
MDNHCNEQHSQVNNIPPLEIEFRCSTCSKMFASSGAMSEHPQNCGLTVEQSLAELFPHTLCEDCSFGTNSKNILEYHTISLHSTYPCSECSAILQTKKAHIAHMQAKHAQVCPHCNIIFLSQQAFLEHEEKQHSKGITCDMCKLQFSDDKSLSSHMSKHTARTCSVCEKLFETVDGLEQHMVDVHPKINMLGKNVCNSCFHVFCTATALATHSEECTVSSGICIHCGESCGSLENVLKHIETKHEEIEIYECALCAHRTIDSTVHLNHQLIHMALPATVGKSTYQCNLCQKWTTSAGSLRTHLNNHNKLKPYRCEFCEFTTSSSGNLRAHRAVRHLHTTDSVKCQICNRKYRTASQMKKHLRMTHYQTLNYQCGICENRFVTELRLKRHLAIVHFDDSEAVNGDEPYAGLSRFRCENCPFSSYSANRFRLHRATHRDRLECPYCDLSFPLLDVLNRHINVRHFKKHVPCPICARRLPNEARLKQHMEACHASDEKELKCLTCGFCFESIAHLEYHCRSHLTVRNFECPTCKKTFTTAASLCVHRQRHTRLEVGNKGKTYVGNSNWVFYCDECKLRFKYKSSLLAHQMVAHSEKTELSCHICSKQPFGSKLLLSYHIRKHLEERANTCEFCQKKFFSPGALKNHVISVHTKAYEIFCSICDKGMLSQARLEMHMIHSHRDTKKRRTKKLKVVQEEIEEFPEPIPLEPHPEELMTADETILSQEIVISTIDEHPPAEDPTPISNGANEDFISRILDDSDPQHLVQITVGSDGDQIGEVDLTGYVME